MKRLTTAVLAATLMCGVSAYAYAQDNTQSAPAGSTAPASGSMGSDQSTQGGMNPAPQGGGTDAGTAAQPGSDSGMGAQSPAGGQPATSAPADAAPPAAGAAPANGMAAPASGGDLSQGAAEQADTPNGAPPSSYPPCTSKTQDRCVQSGRMSSSTHTMKHSMHTHRMKKTNSAASTDANAAPGASTASPQ